MSGENQPPAARPASVVDEEEDVVDVVVRNTGCEVSYRAMEDCIVETDRDFRKCAGVMKDFQQCMIQKKKEADGMAEGSVKKS